MRQGVIVPHRQSGASAQPLCPKEVELLFKKFSNRLNFDADGSMVVGAWVHGGSGAPIAVVLTAKLSQDTSRDMDYRFLVQGPGWGCNLDASPSDHEAISCTLDAGMEPLQK